MFHWSISEEWLLKPPDMGFDLYQICQFFVEFIPLQILKNKVWDLNKLDIQKT